MGRVFYTYEEAARRLGRSSRTIHNYVKKGLLRRAVDNGNVVLHREDVDQLAEEVGADLPAMNRKAFLELHARVRKLEEGMAVMRKMYGIEDRPPLRPSVDEARQLYQNAEEAMVKKTYHTAEIELWVGVFSRIDEITFDLMSKAGLPSSCWMPFFKTCMEMMDYVSDPNRSGANPKWLQQHTELDECRKRLRSTVLMWVEMGKGSVGLEVVRQLGTGRDDLMMRLRR